MENWKDQYVKIGEASAEKVGLIRATSYLVITDMGTHLLLEGHKRPFPKKYFKLTDRVPSERKTPKAFVFDDFKNGKPSYDAPAELLKAIELAGSASSLAFILEVGATSISAWKTGRSRIPKNRLNQVKEYLAGGHKDADGPFFKKQTKRTSTKS